MTVKELKEFIDFRLTTIEDAIKDINKIVNKKADKSTVKAAIILSVSSLITFCGGIIIVLVRFFLGRN